MFPLGSIVLLKGIDDSLKLPASLSVYDFAVLAAGYAGAKLNSDGDLERRTGASAYAKVGTDQWIFDLFKATPGFDPSDYEGGLFSWTGDTLTGGSSALDTYISLDLAPTWYYSTASLGITTGNGQLRVREKVNPSNEVTCTLTLTVEIDTGD